MCEGSGRGSGRSEADSGGFPDPGSGSGCVLISRESESEKCASLTSCLLVFCIFLIYSFVCSGSRRVGGEWAWVRYALGTPSLCVRADTTSAGETAGTSGVGTSAADRVRSTNHWTPGTTVPLYLENDGSK